jgi:hypothetical protein
MDRVYRRDNTTKRELESDMSSALIKFHRPRQNQRS